MKLSSVLRLGVLAALFGAGLSCTSEPVGSAGLPAGRVLLWHSWSGDAAEVLEAQVDRFAELQTDLKVTTIRWPADELAEAFRVQARAGMGPDILLAEQEDILDLVSEGLIQDLGPEGLLVVDALLETAVDGFRRGDELWSVPVALHTQVMLYNVASGPPPDDLEGLLTWVAAGHTLGMDGGMVDTAWGAGAFDGSFFDDQGRIIVAQGGVVNWLEYLRSSRTIPGMVIGPQSEQQHLFEAGKLDAWVTDSVALQELEMVEGQHYKVQTLPRGPRGRPPAPVLRIAGVAVSQVASGADRERAMGLARYLVSEQSQSRLASAPLGLAPANVRVRGSSIMPQSTEALLRQVRTGKVLTLDRRPHWQLLLDPDEGIEAAYHQVIEGQRGANAFVKETEELLVARLGLEVAELQPAALCPAQPGSIELWHTLRDDERRMFEAVIDDFEARCPGVVVTPRAYDLWKAFDAYVEAHNRGEAPTVLYGPSRWLPRLVGRGALKDLTQRVDPAYFQRFIPDTAESMVINGRLYGVPESVLTIALYYDRRVISTPPRDLDDLLGRLDRDTRLALPIDFALTHWATNAFGGFALGEDGQIETDLGLLPWLMWLSSASRQIGVDTYESLRDAEDAFCYGEAAMVVSGPWLLPRLQQEVGTENFRIAALPVGPRGSGAPVLRVQGFMIGSGASPLEVDVALALSRHVNGVEAQKRLASTGSHISAGVHVDLGEYRHVEALRSQAKLARFVLESDRLYEVEKLGTQMVLEVLHDDVPPEVALERFRIRVAKLGEE